MRLDAGKNNLIRSNVHLCMYIYLCVRMRSHILIGHQPWRLIKANGESGS